MMQHLWFERGAYASKQAKKYLIHEFSPEKVKKIAIFRHAALGDQVIVRPFLIEARKFFPNAKITLVGVSNYQYGTPSDLADETIFMIGRHRKHELNWKQKIQQFTQLEEQDIIFDVAGTSRSYWMTLLSKAKLKFGFPYKPYLCGSLYNIAVFRSDFQPELECMLDMLKMLGHNPQRPLDFGYPSHLELYDKEQSKPNILYFNGASTQSKILTQEQMKSFIELAITTFPNHQHVYLEGKNDFEKGDFLRHLEVNRNFTIQSCLPLDELVEYIAKARLVVAPDTGVRNIAVSTHTPTVGIFYSTVPFRYTPLEGDHRIVMNANGDIPSNQQIIAEMATALEQNKETV
ncbi:lipopolysaccharide heptosyltransferase family protein [Vibrio anguillarum]|uniref:Lipopolysaccharide heptosyltransferase family protein n=4 Tax=Vibrio anguillarum TaxID=55601 RepID=A0ABR9Z8L7_VIBAN|nr:lipopolysaccharide heptosyltransferase family protein [Vibrio anguillarum]MBF4276713.1 lipopolysaccharide heptosyltransferase family protein [Vibrio anguillarum]MBF4297503.1 lipopolysaccharide heptosyltransferase family protein [Vibrio anguillarum]MBF4361200.1 lipopolysaccharide heptosyltransferase family protein [Vibrio anguillarum]MBF4374778.1 lipopolysaccharide heptosyltransferase family protein [Vibrio anguillarum]